MEKIAILLSENSRINRSISGTFWWNYLRYTWRKTLSGFYKINYKKSCSFLFVFCDGQWLGVKVMDFLLKICLSNILGGWSWCALLNPEIPCLRLNVNIFVGTKKIVAERLKMSCHAFRRVNWVIYNDVSQKLHKPKSWLVLVRTPLRIQETSLKC